MTSQDIARKWVALLGLGLHPDTLGRDYTPPMPRAMQVAYDHDMDALFEMEDDPYAVILLVATKAVAPRMVDGKPRWSNQTDSGQNRVPPGPDQWKIRSTTYQGIADAMAEQWGTI